MGHAVVDIAVLLGSIAVLLALLVAFVLVVAFGRWRMATRDMLARLTPASRRSGRHRVIAVMGHASADEALAHLPAPVVRYLRHVIPPGQPFVRTAHLRQRGEFLVSPRAGGWRPFHASHTATVAPAGFLWDANIAVAPFTNVFVRDGLLRGEGRTQAALLGLVTLADVRGTPDVAAGSLMRWLAEAAWYPTAFLPGEGVTWTALDHGSARATVSEGGTTVSLDVFFSADGTLVRVYAPERGRLVNGVSVPTPWQGRFARYEPRGGLLVPLEGEVEWILPEGPQPYWRGTLVDARYEYE